MPRRIAAALAVSLSWLALVVPAAAQTITIGDTFVTEGHSGTVDVWFALSATPAPTTELTVDFSTSDGTASAGSDYLATSGTVSFLLEGEQLYGHAVAKVTVKGDLDVEGDETFLVNISNPSAGTIADAQGVATILDDEGTTYRAVPAGWMPTTEGMTWAYGLGWDGATAVAVGYYGEIWTSPDSGVTWTRRYNPDPQHRTLRAVARGGAGWVAVGESTGSQPGTCPAVLTSPDGTTWTVRDVSGTYWLGRFRAVTDAGGLYVAVGNNGRIGTSPDGVTWTARTSTTGALLNGVAAAGSTVVAVGNSRAIVRSTNGGIDWGTVGGVPTSLGNLQAVTWTGSQFVAVGDAGGTAVSADGSSWTASILATANALRGVAANGGTILAVGSPSASLPADSVFTSTDGSSWSPQSLPIVHGVSQNLNAVVSLGAGGFLAVGSGGAVYGGATATENRTLAGSRAWEGVARGGGRFCAVGMYGAVAWSADGVSWTPAQGPVDALGRPRNWAKVAHDGSRFVAVGWAGGVITSPDCVTWTDRSLAPPPGYSSVDLLHVAYGAGLFVAVGGKTPTTGTKEPFVATSPDGTAWTERPAGLAAGTYDNLTGVAFGPSGFVASGSDFVTANTHSFLTTSPDGTSWAEQPYPHSFADNYNDMAASATLMLGTGGRPWASRDGQSWTPLLGEHENAWILACASGGDRHVLGGYGRVYGSADGSRWSVRDFPDHLLSEGAYAGESGRFVLVGTGVLLYSVDAVRPADFSADLRSDLFWRNTSTGDNGVWLMRGADLVEVVPVPSLDTSWTFAGSGDFDGDGGADVFWRQASTGENAVWFNDGPDGYTTAVPAPWAVAGVGDFDGDGRADVLWRDAASGTNAVWFMDATTVAGTALLTSLAGSWAVAGIVDFDHDGHADILWRDPATGDNAIWLMNGAAIVSGALLTPVATTWSVAGVGDFDGDLKADILWREGTAGDNAVWFMDGATVASGALLPSLAPPWTVAGIGDFDGSDRSDVLWRNTSTGENAMWFMNGATLASGGWVQTVADGNWVVAAPR